ncbi:glycosyltransferase family 4 protein [Mycobacterium kubicae]|uniref:glycosyltransferase n=1 Tax=Mycobacterium kubicae TaxID=120959 RepID=UPI00163FE2AF|nr:glycosyltransferase [Mycobacterium kubicae]QNI07649.1 glycosyltransferase family 4 protein [Mycobacterium kubicae]
MHVALFTDLHPDSLGGTQVSVATQRRALELRGHRVTVFTAPLPKAVDPDPCVVELKPVPVVAPLMRKLGRHDDFMFVWPSKRNRAIIDDAFNTGEPIDLVHTHGDLGVAIAGVEAARRHGIPVVQTKHTRFDVYFEQATATPLVLALLFAQMQNRHLSRDFNLLPVKEGAASRLAWRLMVAHAQAVDHEITPTRHFAESLARRGVSRPISAISNGVDDDVIDRAAAVDVVRPADDEPLRLIWCGRLSSEKRVLAAVEAVAQVDHCTLDIYGDGHLDASIRKLIETAGLSQRVRLRGRVDREQCLVAMRTSGALLFTSYDFDTQGLVLLEAAAMSLPTIYCDPALSETVPDGGGLLSADPSPEALAASIRELVGDRNRLRHMTDIVTTHRDTARQSLQTDKIIDIYHSLVDPVPA